MQCFELPCHTSKHLYKCNRDFFWKKFATEQGLPMIAWDKVCMPQVIGGLRLHKTEPTNKAFQCKLAWKILTTEPSLWVRSMRTKYLYESELFRCPRRSTDSPVWKSIMKTRDLLKSSLIWKVGKGNKISFCLDKWVEN